MNTDMPLQKRPLVSVILPTYNRAHTLGRAIRSVLAQTYDNLELIIADDASTDNTRELISSIADSRIRYVRHEPNGGASAARNLGIAHARGEFIAFHDSDDEWLLDKLEMQLEALEAQGEHFGATFGGKLLYGREPGGHYGEGLCVYRPHRANAVRSGRITTQLLEQNLISPQTLLVRASVARETGPFNERLPGNEDWEYMLRLSMKTRVLYTNRPVVIAYISDDSISLDMHANCRGFMMILKIHAAAFMENPKLYSGRYYATARYLHCLKRYRAAVRFLRRAIQLDPWSYKAWVRLVQAWFAARIDGLRRLTRTRRPREIPTRLQAGFPGSGLIRARARVGSSSR